MISHRCDRINIEKNEQSIPGRNIRTAIGGTARMAVTGSQHEHPVGQVAAWYRLILAPYVLETAQCPVNLCIEHPSLDL